MLHVCADRWLTLAGLTPVPNHLFSEANGLSGGAQDGARGVVAVGRGRIGVVVAITGPLPVREDEAAGHVFTRLRAGVLEAQNGAGVGAVL